MKIGFFGGSFNPVSNIHINLANNLIKEFKLDKVIFVPVGNYYEKESLIDAKHRFNMLSLAIKNNPNLAIENIAVETKTKLYTIDIFKLLKQKYKNDDIFFIMGSDNYRKMPTWRMYEELINNYNIIVVERERKEIRVTNRENILCYIPQRIETVNSTIIRNMIKDKEDTKGFLNPQVYEYIVSHNLYKV